MAVNVPGSLEFRHIMQSIMVKRYPAFPRTGLEADIEMVNRFANDNIRQASDIDLYGQNDRWSTPDEIIAMRAGDCEDLAILKWSALFDMGYPPDMFCIATVMNRATNNGHAVLVCSEGNRNLILDSMRSYVYSDQEEKWYDPLYAYGSAINWRFG